MFGVANVAVWFHVLNNAEGEGLNPWTGLRAAAFFASVVVLPLAIGLLVGKPVALLFALLLPLVALAPSGCAGLAISFDSRSRRCAPTALDNHTVISALASAGLLALGALAGRALHVAGRAARPRTEASVGHGL